MLSLKRLGYILLIVLAFCSIFLIYSVHESNNKLLSISNEAVEEEPLQQSKESIRKSDVTFVVVGNEKRVLYQDIYANVCTLLGDMKVSWRRTDAITDADLDVEHTVLIFCDDAINAYMDVKDCMQFIEDGGRVILAAGLAEGYTDSYLTPAFGIIEKSIKENYNTFCFDELFLPLQEDVMTYDGYNASTWIKVRDDAIVYALDEESQVPVIYQYPYGKGKSFIFNTTILADSRCVGLLAAGICACTEDFIYPVLGTECVFLDNFPAVTYVDDAQCMKLYGRTTESFVLDVIWPVFQEMAVEDDIRYTSSVMAVASSKTEFTEKTDSLFFTMQKSALQFHGEMGYGVNCKDEKAVVLDDDFIDRFSQAFSNYTISSVVMMSEEPVEKAVALFGDDITAVRGSMYGKKSESGFAYNDSYFVFPEATRGGNLEKGDMLTIASVLAGYGMVSHTFDVNALIRDDLENLNWDENKIALSEFEQRVFQKVPYLESQTLSEMRNKVNSYLNLEYGWNCSGDTMELVTDRYVQGQAFLLHSNRSIRRIAGATIEEMGNSYYLLRITDSHVTIYYEGE